MKDADFNEGFGKTIEEKLQMVRDSFGPNKCQCLNTLTRDLFTCAIDAKIKECILLHDYRARLRKAERQESKETAEGNIRIYEELKKQIEALPVCGVCEPPIDRALSGE